MDESFKLINKRARPYVESHRYFHKETKKIVAVAKYGAFDHSTTLDLSQKHPQICYIYGRYLGDLFFRENREFMEGREFMEAMDICLFKLVGKIKRRQNKRRNPITYISEQILGYIAVVGVDVLNFVHLKGITLSLDQTSILFKKDGRIKFYSASMVCSKDSSDLIGDIKMLGRMLYDTMLLKQMDLDYNPRDDFNKSFSDEEIIFQIST